MRTHTLQRLALAAALAALLPAHAAVTPEEAARLKNELTPFGAERAGNKEGTIPPWTGGYTTPIPGFKNGGRRGDPFASEKSRLEMLSTTILPVSCWLVAVNAQVPPFASAVPQPRARGMRRRLG